MKKVMILLVLSIALTCGIVGTSTASQVGVIDVSLDPEVFFPHDTGTVTIVIKNTGTDSVELSRVNLQGTRSIYVIESPHYIGVGRLGAGDTMTTSFTIRAGNEEGIFYPRFSLNFVPSGNMMFPISLKVDKTPIEAGIKTRPDTFMEGKKDVVVVSVGNPRENSLSGVTITPQTGIANTVPTSIFIGTLQPGEKKEAEFSVTPTGTGDITFNVEYRNGQNRQTVPLTIPVVPGTAKRVPEPIVSNVEVTSIAGGYRITGDVSNAGLETARSVVMTTKDPAEPIDPFRVYVVGALDADDFSSFEVTFTAKDAETVPLVTRYRDDDGNLYEEVTHVTIQSGPMPVAEQDGISPMVIGIIGLSVVIVAGALLYSRKKR
ncbi:hypothetical protein [Methanocalculus sp.]|uniref:COG1361 S-layer family protein n=1 Tax=Methanocalculus sp. TaxID=2004547 RepID=UPI00261488E6|nr:hypothetical protein [Methanocalculus sp.]MDG6249808.1 hypothetical protein [Methanocalculus sp.]